MRMLNSFATTLRSEVDVSEAIGGQRNKERIRALAARKARFDDDPRLRCLAALVFRVRHRLLRGLRHAALFVVPRAATLFRITGLDGPSTSRLFDALETISLASRSASERAAQRLHSLRSSEREATEPWSPSSVRSGTNDSATPRTTPHTTSRHGPRRVDLTSAGEGNTAKVAPALEP